jgi:hypothetical protein
MKIYRIAGGFVPFKDMENGTVFLHPWYQKCSKYRDTYLLTPDNLKVPVENVDEEFVILG